ncbi:MAG: bile acid:sodium symporter family protein [Bdellovibrionales bacterium]
MDAKSSFILMVMFPVAIALIMFGLGLGLKREDFLRLRKYPMVTFLGLVAKILIMPATAVGLSYLFGLGPEFTVGMILVAAGPCGVMANVFTKMANGNVALGLTFTALDNFIGGVTLPLYASLAVRFLAGEEAKAGVLFGDSIKIFLLIVVPVSIGMLARNKIPNFVARAESILRVFSMVFVVVLIVTLLGRERAHIFNNFAELGLVTLLLSMLGLFYGYLVGRILGYLKSDSIALAFAMPIQGTAVIGTVAISVLNNINYAIPAAIYTIFMYVTGFAGVWIFARLK